MRMNSLPPNWSGGCCPANFWTKWPTSSGTSLCRSGGCCPDRCRCHRSGKKIWRKSETLTWNFSRMSRMTCQRMSFLPKMNFCRTMMSSLPQSRSLSGGCRPESFWSKRMRSFLTMTTSFLRMKNFSKTRTSVSATMSCYSSNQWNVFPVNMNLPERQAWPT